MIRVLSVIIGVMALAGLLGAELLFPGQAAAFEDKFRQLDDQLPTPNVYRNGAGAPGRDYWQQQVDYKIKVDLDETKRTITGTATITYHNNAPDTLRYLWLQVEQNVLRPDSELMLAKAARTDGRYTFDEMRAALNRANFPGGYTIRSVRDQAGKALPYAVVETMMRIDLPAPLAPGTQTSFQIEWSYNIPEQRVLGGRAGYEYFPEDGNNIFEIAQWYPRLAAYSDVKGWHSKPFLGIGEFALEFGNFEVAITVPADHIVAATGSLANANEVLSAEQRQRLETAKTAKTPQFIVTPAEASAAEKSRTARKATWVFKADNVRDFAFASSRKFIWDAWGYAQKDGPFVMAMSFYPQEGLPLWDKYSTQAIAHTLEQYSKYTLPYPYPTAQSVNGPVGGMEYPMISFNGPRPEKGKDGRVTYSKTTKYELISVIIHEVGHNYFPMIVNSDERQWMWMDEGLNTFLQYLAEQAWETGYPSKRGDPRKIIDYMTSAAQVPIMTGSDSLISLGNNAYAKPATALNILRETILGRELFDYAFREYVRRWKFKRPMPADFFRTIEDASGVDLDWFWRGWFYTTDHVDIAIDSVKRYRIDSKNPVVEKLWERRQEHEQPQSVTDQRNQGLKRRVDQYPDLKDFYNRHDDDTVTKRDRDDYQAAIADLTPAEQALLKETAILYMVEFSNRGGLVMPIILAIDYADGSTETMRIPAEIWRQTPGKVSKLIVARKEIKALTVDPHWETADTDVSNNSWPPKPTDARLELYKDKPERNLMRDLAPAGAAP